MARRTAPPRNAVLLHYNPALAAALPPKNSLGQINVKPKKVTSMIDRIKLAVRSEY